MRVLHVYRTYFPDPPGGLQEAIRQICRSTRTQGVDNRIFCLSPDPEPAVLAREEAVVVRARSWAAPASCDIGLRGAMRSFVEQACQADIVHYHFPWPFADVLHALAGARKPAVMTYHSDVVGKGWLGGAYQPLMRRTLTSMDAIVATSPAYVESSVALGLPRVRERVTVIPLGINEDSYDAALAEGRRIDLRARFKLPEVFMLFVGVLRPYKGLDTLIAAASDGPFHIAIAGDGRDAARLRERAAGLTNVHFLGQVSDAEKMALLDGCRALVLPSHLRSEAFGMVLVEASMRCKPLVSCEIGTGTTFVNRDRETGIVVPPEDAAALARAMQALHDDPDMAQEMGQRARQRYQCLFSGEALGRAYVDLYRRVVDV